MTHTLTIDEVNLIRSSVRQVLATTGPALVPSALVEMGWPDLVQDAPADSFTVLTEEAGRARSVAPVADLAVVWGAGLGSQPTTAVMIDGLVLSGAERAERFLCLSTDLSTAVPSMHLVDASAVSLQPVQGFDPALGLSRATVELSSAEGVANASGAIAAGRRALASQMVGACEQMLTETLAYVNERHQYGRAIGSFQTVKHRLADVKVATTAAKAAVAVAWKVAESDGSDDDATTLSIAAKVLAGRAQQLASTHCFQVHGGIAFTVEHGFQQWVRRGLLLDLLLGGNDQLTVELGNRLIAQGRVPRVPNLWQRT